MISNPPMALQALLPTEAVSFTNSGDYINEIMSGTKKWDITEVHRIYLPNASLESLANLQNIVANISGKPSVWKHVTILQVEVLELQRIVNTWALHPTLERSPNRIRALFLTSDASSMQHFRSISLKELWEIWKKNKYDSLSIEVLLI